MKMQTLVWTTLLLLVAPSLCVEPSGIRHFRHISECTWACKSKTPLANVQKCCVQQKAGNWGTCTQYFQAVCARKDVTWSADGETLCSYYGFGFECMDRYQLGGS